MFGVRKGLHRDTRAAKDGPALQVLSFVASASKLPTDSFAPATKVVGRFQLLRSLSKFPYLCEYVEISKSAHGRMFVVSERSGSATSLASLVASSSGQSMPTLDQIRKWTLQIVLTMAYLHSHGLVHLNLNLSNVLVEPSTNSIKLSNYGMYFLTGNGADVMFPIGLPHYLSPEEIAAGPHSGQPSSPKSDIWSLGILLLELYAGPATVLSWTDQSTSRVLDTIVGMDPSLADFIRSCLATSPADRPSAMALAHSPFLQQQAGQGQLLGMHINNHEPWFKKPHLFEGRLSSAVANSPAATDPNALSRPGQQSASSAMSASGYSVADRLSGMAMDAEARYPLSLGELFYYWKMAGGDLDLLVLKTGVTNTPSLGKLPSLVRFGENVEELLLASQSTSLFSDCHTAIPVDHIWTKLDAFESVLIRPESVLDAYKDDWKHVLPFAAQNLDKVWESYQQTAQLKLSLANKESDIGYQYCRVRMFHRLLCKYPSSISAIRNEAVSDVPPLLRGKIWAALLHVRGDVDAHYDMFDKDTEKETDRQLDLDIPRCHQYNELLSSPIGHYKLKRVLKAWIEGEKGKHVYWQGLDSMCAPFVTLNFEDEGLAFASMRSFITNYCEGFFVNDNSKLMREFMLAFRYVLSFHDPELSSHLFTIGLGPELFAISWFMTLFAHVLPLDKIYHLWDHFLVGPPFLFIYVGVSILQQHRDQLLASDFNQAMLLFSELPAINVEQCIIYSLQAAKITPPSLLSHLRAFMRGDHPASPQDPNAWNAVKRFSFLNNKKGIVGGISVADFVEMRRHAMTIDTRRIEVFRGGHVAGSMLAVPSQVQSLSFGVKILLSRDRYLVVISSGDEEGSQFASMLVREKQPRVTLLVVTEPNTLVQVSPVVSLCTCSPQPFGASSASGQGLFRCTQAGSGQ
ncbi:rab-GTPase-TBC domain-containing protein [Entophlyctis helioformis]|nr:rab-GTPase-TBC domain-containing protein [Entophlyctis helioformis]